MVTTAPLSVFSSDLFNNYIMGGKGAFGCEQAMRYNAVHPELIETVVPVYQISTFLFTFSLTLVLMSIFLKVCFFCKSELE